MTKLIPKNVSFSHNSGRLFTELVCEELVTIAEEAYEVTCPSTPDNEPEQPQEEVPQEDPWPDISMPIVLTRNSFYGESVIDDKTPKSIYNVNTPSYSILCADSLNNKIYSNVVSSNNYVYCIGAGPTIYRKAIRPGLSDLSYPFTSHHTYQWNITLLEEDVIAYYIWGVGDFWNLTTIDMKTGTKTVLASIPNYEDDLWLLRDGWMNNISSFVGDDGKIYIVMCFYWQDISDGFPIEKLYYYVYNYTDRILYDPIVLDLPDYEYWNESDIWLTAAPVILGNKIVYSYNLDPYNPEGDVWVAVFYCIDVVTRIGQWTTFTEPDVWDYYPMRLTADRIIGQAFCVFDVIPGDPNDTPVVRYDVNTNVASLESHYNRSTENCWCYQDINYAYKAIGLDADPKAFYKLTIGASEYLFDLPYTVDWFRGRHDRDDETDGMWTLGTDGILKHAGGTSPSKQFDLSAIPDLDFTASLSFYLQGNHAFIYQKVTDIGPPIVTYYRTWVVYE